MRRPMTQQQPLVHDAHRDFTKLVQDLRRQRVPDVVVNASSERTLTAI
jgi:hypothetical protein